jgi:ankyrin repeat protein
MVPYLNMETEETQTRLIQSLFYAGVDLNVGYDTHGTPLFAAAARSLKNIVSLLLKLGCNPNVRNKESGNTPLHGVGMDISPVSVDIAKMLLFHGAEINPVNMNGSTQLDYVRSSHPETEYKKELEEFLRSKGAVYGKDLKQNNHNTP